MLTRGLLFVGLLMLAACSQAPIPTDETLDLAAQRLGTTADETVIDIAVDTKAGAVYALGLTDGSLDGPNQGGRDVFLRRYSRSGAVVWKRQFGTADFDFAGDVAVDRSGYVYAGYNNRLEKRLSDGTLVWDRTVLWKDAADRITALSTDTSGNLYVGGDGGSDSGKDLTVFLRKYTGAGSELWTRSDEGGVLGYTTVGVDTDAQGNIYQAASESDDGDNGYLTGTVFKYSPTGRRLFAKTVDKPADDGTKDIYLDGLAIRGSTLYLAGRLQTNWGEPLLPRDANAFIAKFSLSGVERWRRVFGTSGSDGASSVSVDASGGIYVTGYTFGDLGGVYNGKSDAFFRKYSPSGLALWTKQIGSAGDDGGTSVVAYSSNELYLAGYAGGALIGGTHRGSQDGFLRRTDGQGKRVWTDQ